VHDDARRRPEYGAHDRCRARVIRPTNQLRTTCVHEYAHLVVARGFGACGFVTIARIAWHDGAEGWCGCFQLFGELTDEEWRIVALAGTIAEWIDMRVECDAGSLFESLQRPRALSDSDARLARGYDAGDVERCLRLVTMSWREIETQATERAASVEANQAAPPSTSP